MLGLLARAVLSVVLLLTTACDGGPTAPTDAERIASIPWEKLSGIIAYSRQCGSGAYCIDVIDVPTRTLRQVKRLDGNPIIGDVALSADGSSVLYSYFLFGTSLNAPPAFWRIESVAVASGTRSTVVSLGSTFASHPAVAKDGRVAYLRTGTVGREICVVGGDCTPTRNFLSTRPTWSPDGSAIAFVLEASGGIGIYSSPLGVGPLTLTVAGDGVGAGTSFNNPAYSPDGSRIAYDRYGSTFPGTEIWTAAVDGTDRHRIVGGAVMTGGYGAAWSGDGSHLIYVGGDGGQSAIRLVRNDGTQDISILRSQDWINSVTWRP